jgi:hypothetical protein
MSCSMRLFNDPVGSWLGNKPFICVCYGNECCREDESCPNPAKRLARGPGLKGRRNAALEQGHQQDAELAIRATGDYSWSADRNGQTYSGTYTAIPVCGGSQSDGLRFQLC